MDTPDLLFERHPNPMLIFDLDTLEIVEVNKRAEKKYGYTRDEFLNLTVKDIRPPEDIPEMHKMLEELKDEIQIYDRGTIRHQTKDGSILYVQITAQSFTYKNKNVRIVHIHDVTETTKLQKKIEEAYREQHHLMDNNPLGMVKFDKDFRVIEWSKTAAKSTGWSKDEVLGNSIYDLGFFDEEEAQDVKQRLSRIASGKTDKNRFETVVQVKDGSSMEVLVHASALYDHNGKLKSVLSFIEDVTEKNKAQDELKKNKELFESLFLDSPVAIAMIDVEGKVQRLNTSFKHLFGYSEEELAGKDLLKHQLPEERHDEIEEIYEHVFSGEGTSKYYEDQRMTKSGELKDLLVGALPVVIGDEPIAAFGIYTDITKLRSIEKDLKDSLEEKEILLAEIHHRVKNNLAVISGLLELESMNWHENREIRNVLNNSMLRIKSIAMIHEQLYKSEDFANLEFEDYLQELVNLVSDTLNVKEKVISVQIESDDIKINVNQAIPCALIVNELVTNAFEHAFNDLDNGELRVELKQNRNAIQILVADNGPGLPENFTLKDNSSLGLTMVQQLIKQLNGTLRVNNKAGAQFEIEFQAEKKSGSASNHFV